MSSWIYKLHMQFDIEMLLQKLKVNDVKINIIKILKSIGKMGFCVNAIFIYQNLKFMEKSKYFYLWKITLWKGDKNRRGVFP